MHLQRIALILSLFVSAPAISQDEPTDAQKLEEAMRVVVLLEKQLQRLEAQLQPTLDPKAKAAIDAYHESWIEFFDHQQHLREHTMAALSWQLRAAYFVTFVVVGVVGLGIYLSIVEVRAALKAGPKDIRHEVLAQESGATVRDKIELTVSLQKLQVTSAVTGVAILVLSLGFLYLFVKEVFELDPQDFSAYSVPAEVGEENTKVVGGSE